VTTRELPEWQGEQREEKGEQPHKPCAWPDIEPVTVSGVDGGFLNAEQLTQLKACRAIATATHKVAVANADSVDSLIGALNKTNEQGERQTRFAEFELNELERDRRDANLEAWTYKGVLALVLIAVAL